MTKLPHAFEMGPGISTIVITCAHTHQLHKQHGTGAGKQLLPMLFGLVIQFKMCQIINHNMPNQRCTELHLATWVIVVIITDEKIYPKSAVDDCENKIGGKV